MKIRIYIIVAVCITIFLPLNHKILSNSDEIVCENGTMMNNSLVMDVPEHDYGSDGLVRFHLNLKPGGFGGQILAYLHYSDDCTNHGGTFPTFAYQNTLPDITHLLIKAVNTSGDFFNFQVFNEDTGESISGGIGPMPIDFSITDSPVVGIKMYTSDGYPGFPGYTEYGFQTPIVSLRQNSFPPAAVRTPVLIIPGVTGTEIKDGGDLLWPDIGKMITTNDRFMDDLAFNNNLNPVKSELQTGVVLRNPLGVFDYSDGLIEGFEGQGYTEGQDLFTFPYDWRYGVSGDIASQLKGQIDYILNQTSAGQAAGKVDVVAHSMGGLVVKRYVTEYPNHHINKAVFVGVPNTGAPKSIKVLLMGDSFGVTGLNDEEMKFIAENMPAVYDLSPSERYYANKGSYLRTVTQTGLFSSETNDLSFDEANDFLVNVHNLNNQAISNSQGLHTLGFDNLDLRQQGIDLYSIVGCKAGTIGKITETLVDASEEPLYELSETPGDGTVPLESATNLPVDERHKFYTLNANHGKMLSQDGVRQKIVNIISGSSLDVGNKLTQDIGKCKLKGKAVSIYSPLSIEALDQNGNRAGLNADGSIENDIPDADYTIAGDRKFVFLPTDENQTYTVNLAGTGSGAFTLKVSNLEGNNVTQTEVFADIAVSSSTKAKLLFLDSGTELQLDANGDGAYEQSIQPNFILNPDESADVVRPATSVSVSGGQDADGNYAGSAEVGLAAQDIVVPGMENQTSGPFLIKYSLDGGFVYHIYTQPIVFSESGPYTIKYYSMDRAGNKESLKAVQFTVTSQDQNTTASVGGGWSSGGGSNVVPPDFSISATGSPVSITLEVVGSHAAEMQFSSSVNFQGLQWLPFATSTPWILSEGANEVCGRFKDVSGYIFSVVCHNVPAYNPMGKVLGVSTESLPHKPGTLVLDKDGRTIYMIGKGRKFGFRSPDEYFTYGYEFSDAVPANMADHLLPDADIVKAKPGTLVNTWEGYYLITENGVKSRFRGASTVSFKGYIPKTAKVMDVSDYQDAETVTEFNPIETGLAIFTPDL